MPTPKAQQLMESLREVHGESSIMMASDMPQRPPVSSGSLALDFAVGIGGFPSDRVIEIAGAEGTGKSTLALLAMANCLDANPKKAALILDLEHKLDIEWITKLIGPERASRVILTWPTYVEEATNIYADAVGGNEKKKISPGQICCAIFDSIGGAPSSRRNDDFTVASFAGNTLAIKEFAQLAAGLSHTHACLTIGVNQIRDDMKGYNRHMVPGGHAWLHAVILRLALKKGQGKAFEKINDEEFQVGYEVACKVVKNGLAAPGRTASYWFYNVPTEKYGFGVDTIEEVMRLGVLTGVIDRRGGWYHHPLLPESKGEHRILGRDRVVAYLREDHDAQRKLGVQVMERLRTGDYGKEVAPVSADPEAEIPNGYTNLLTEPLFAEELDNG